MEVTMQEEVRSILGIFFMSILLILGTIISTFLFIDFEKDKNRKDIEKD